jgi:hypothetical protein
MSFQGTFICNFDVGGGGSAYTPPPETQVIYVGKHGNDANSGRNIEAAKLTLGAAITAATALTPGPANRIAIVCHDSGEYTESLTLPQWVSLYAPLATVSGEVTVNGDVVMELFKIAATANNQFLLTKTGANTTAYVTITEMDGSAFTSVTSVRNLSNNGVLFVKAGKILVGASGTGVGDQSNGIGHIHLMVDDLYLVGNSSVAIAKVSGEGNVVVYVQHILETGAPTGTTGVLVGATGEVYVYANEIIADTAYNVTAGGILRGFVANLSGVQTGAASLVNANIFAGSKTANTVLAAPNGSAGNPSFRALAAADINAALLAGTGRHVILAAGQSAANLGLRLDDAYVTGLWSSSGSLQVTVGSANVALFTSSALEANNGTLDGCFYMPRLGNSVTAPTYSFRGDTNTGIYWISDNVFAFAAGGVQIAEFAQTNSSIYCNTGFTSSVSTGLTVGHRTSGVAANNFGVALKFNAESSSGNQRDVGRVRVYYVNATDASRTVRIVFSAQDFNAERDGFAIEANGSAVLLGFYGAPPVAQSAYGAPTGTPTRTTFDTATVTLPQLAERVKAMIDDLRSVGMFG